MFINENLLGVVLCGGKSERMGQDKGLMTQSGNVWAKIMSEKLQSIHLPVVLSINPSQALSYGSLFKSDELVIDNTNIAGPLAGILSVHTQFPNHDLLVLPCDMIYLKTESLEHLKKITQEQGSEFDFINYQNSDGITEPMPGVYTREGLDKVFKQYLTNTLSKMSLKYVLETGNSLGLEFNGQAEELKNINHKEDIF